MGKDLQELTIRDVIIYTGRIRKFNDEEFKETKRRPAVIICIREIDGERVVLAVPLNSTAEEEWTGPRTRYNVLPTKNYVDYLKSLTADELEELIGVKSVDFTNFNNIKEISQASVNNAFFVQEGNFRKKIGSIDSTDYECVKYMFLEYVRWLQDRNA